MPSSESSGITVDDNVDLTIEEVESSTAIVFANRRMQQQQQPLPFGSVFLTFQPEVINPRENHSRNMPINILHVPRPIINQPSQLNFAQSQNLSTEAYYPRGQRPRLSYGSSSRAEEIAQGDANLGTQPNQDSPQIPRLITNNLYDPSYAARGLPMDPHLRAILTNPDFFIIPKPNQSKR